MNLRWTGRVGVGDESIHGEPGSTQDLIDLEIRLIKSTHWG